MSELIITATINEDGDVTGIALTGEYTSEQLSQIIGLTFTERKAVNERRREANAEAKAEREARKAERAKQAAERRAEQLRKAEERAEKAAARLAELKEKAEQTA